MDTQADVLLTVIVIELALLLGGLYYAAQKAQAEVSGTAGIVTEVGNALQAII